MKKLMLIVGEPTMHCYIGGVFGGGCRGLNNDGTAVCWLCFVQWRRRYRA